MMINLFRPCSCTCTCRTRSATHRVVYYILYNTPRCATICAVYSAFPFSVCPSGRKTSSVPGKIYYFHCMPVTAGVEYYCILYTSIPIYNIIPNRISLEPFTGIKDSDPSLAMTHRIYS